MTGALAEGWWRRSCVMAAALCLLVLGGPEADAQSRRAPEPAASEPQSQSNRSPVPETRRRRPPPAETEDVPADANPSGRSEIIPIGGTRGTPGPQSEADPEDDFRQSWFLPSPVDGFLMRAVTMRPKGDGPFPLVVINHGTNESLADRVKFSFPRFSVLSEYFLKKGYAVLLVQRLGHGVTGGPYYEGQNGCEDADYKGSGIRTAEMIQKAIDYIGQQSFVRKGKVLVVGESAGGWGAIALASLNPASVAAVINFSGGRGGHVGGKKYNNCAPDRLVEAAGEYGKTARIPSLWLYARNDTFFSAELSRRMSDAYRKAGGLIEYKLFPPFQDEGHNIVVEREARRLWAPAIDAFLETLPAEAKP